jgi:formylglycine-generating enzyme required for sulfatase activity
MAVLPTAGRGYNQCDALDELAGSHISGFAAGGANACGTGFERIANRCLDSCNDAEWANDPCGICFAGKEIQMNDTGRRTDRMGPRISSPASMFEKVLRAFAEGDLHYADVQLDLKRLLKSGAPPQKLLEVLERWELIEPLPDYAHAGVLRLIDEAIDLAEAQNADTDAAQAQIQDSISAAAATAPVPAHPAAQDAQPAPSPGDGARSEEESIERESSDYQALSRAYEHARDAASVATARAIALAGDLTAVRAALELERSKSREFYTALTERRAADEAARSRGEEIQRESQRCQAELRVSRDSLAAHEKTLAQVRHALGERDTQLAALQQEHAMLVPAGQRKAQEFDAALAEKIALHEAAVSQREEAQRETERYRTELRTVRDALAARDKTIAQVRHSLVERDAQLTALQQEQAKIVATLQARAKSAESELQAARSRIDAELGAEQARSNSYLEVLETREWRRGFDQNRFREMEALGDVAGAVCDVPRAAESQATAQIRPSDARPAPKAPRPSERAARIAPSSSPSSPSSPLSPPSKRGQSWRRGETARVAGVGVAILVVLVCVAWFFVHRVSIPAKAPAVSSAAVPKPGTVFRDCPTCPGLTVLAAGRFKQGSAGAESGAPSFEKPLHWVVIGHPFAMSTNAVTLDEFRAFITATGRDMQGCDVYDGEWKRRADSSWENPAFVQTGSHPVTCVSWDDAKAYAAWLSAQTGHRYRLPSASEWEYAARAGGEADQPWGANGSDACASANVADQSAARRFPGWTVFGCDDGYVYTAPVGSFKASAFGLNDMLGNVFQWTEDCWHEDYKGAPIDGSARTVGDCSEHELRGGSWFSTPAFVRADYRNHFPANYRTSSVGIRLVRDLAP